jgi:hypothetical protein
MVAFLRDGTFFPLTGWNIFVASWVEATFFGYVAHYCLDGIEP